MTSTIRTPRVQARLAIAMRALVVPLALAGCIPRGEGTEPGDCTDGADNDRDGLFDCDDDGCAGSPDCEEADTDTDVDTDSDTDTGSTDADGDGWTVAGGDCDDSDAGVHPEAGEVAADGVDQDCDGGDDCFRDDDRDGFGSGTTIPSEDLDCSDRGESSVSTDCDDDDPFTYPGAPESTADGIDQDCDGGDDCYQDADGDGYGTDETISSVDRDCRDPGEASGDGDCDDGDPAVNPGAEEICRDGVDNNCDASSSPCSLAGIVHLSAAEAKLVGENTEDYAGYSIAVGDVDGDGFGDVLVGAYGEDVGAYNTGVVYGVLGPISGTMDLSEADAELVGDTVWGRAGSAVASGDVNRDGVDDVIVGAPRESSGGDAAGTAYLVLGPLAGTTSLSTADATLIGEDADDNAGCSVAMGDVDGDGIEDILVGAFHEESSGSNGGAAYLVAGPAVGTIDLSRSTAKFTGESANDYAGFSVAAGDLDGDGFSDVIVGSWSDAGDSNSGAVYVVDGPVTGTLNLSLADSKAVGESSADSAGYSLATGDLDGDGVSDLLTGAPYANEGESTTGAAYVITRPFTGTMNLASADAVLDGELDGDFAGVAVDAADVDDDGVADVIVGASTEDSGGTSAGAVYIVYGPVAGTLPLSSADAKIIGENGADRAGRSVASGDVDDDGVGDVVVGAPWESTGGGYAGAVYLLLGGGG